MHITISADGDLALADPTEFTAFDIRSSNTSDAFVLDALGDGGAVCDEDNHAFVEAELVRRLAGSAIDEKWEIGFAKMLDYAATKGWLDESGKRIKAHIEAPL